jgi:VIT1/CCC1 family predicted Fe2+/Mn2+ transporter
MDEPHKKGNKISDIILGGQDGLVSILGLMLGLSAATSSSRIVIAGGLATVFAETLSMTAVAYTSKMADRDHYTAEKKREVKEMIEVSATEKQEIRDIYLNQGFNGQLLDDIVNHITSDNKLWLNTMMRDELNLLPIERRDVYLYSLIVGISTLSGAVLPLIPFFFLPIHIALIVAFVVSITALAIIGIYKANMTLGKPLKSALQMIVIGIGAAVAGYLIGLVFKP